jgi:hypothetical protein
MEDPFEKAAEMARANAGPFRQHIDGKIVP